ncbi:arsenic resistance protein [Halalkalicoccus jeotgali]|uniref:Bile acid:sodium symporter n=1 Tax=Halalkalicoccus jeotgali (strain DSM 18796 / CECT 7217 / JCM 14584 / KCTC 4019 / B3) TaxID=795797 RepID=D8J3E9_HALJB|nr:bile acid:sodium symporter [Halalkalicoccus jeotgali]ADJ15256.1 Bile acid:sodium symporter [Halalkalicoccus jeotgali B3]ELY35323.1 Bile acid:sodium symporter [Halalkalicoccus jeotgali B3]
MDSKRWLQRHQVVVYTAFVFLAVSIGLGRPNSATVFERLIDPVLAVLLYVTFLEIPFVRLRRAFRNQRFIAAALGMNFLVVPVVVWGLTRFLPRRPVILVGAFMVLLTPCIDYVITFTELVEGDSEQITATTPVLMLVQLLLLPVYLWLFMGWEVAEVIEPEPFVEAFLIIIALPLTLAWLTEVWAERSSRGKVWGETMGWLPVPMMGATLFVVIASQLPRVQNSIGQIAVVIPVYVAFLAVMPILGRLAAGVLEMDAGESRALVFTSVTRNSLVVLPLALALPPDYRLAPAVVVTQTLVELVGMVTLTRIVPAWLVPESPKRTALPELMSRE